MENDSTAAAAYMAGVIQSCYEDNRVGPMTVRNINEKLRDADLEHVQIEMD
jgi:hypothetical protein